MNADDYAEHIRRLVDDAPPLSDAQIARLKALLKPALTEKAVPAPAAPRKRDAA